MLTKDFHKRAIAFDFVNSMIDELYRNRMLPKRDQESVDATSEVIVGACMERRDEIMKRHGFTEEQSPPKAYFEQYTKAFFEGYLETSKNDNLDDERDSTTEDFAR